MNSFVGWAILGGVLWGILLNLREKNPEKENFEQAIHWLQQVSNEGKGRPEISPQINRVSQRTGDIVLPD